MSFVNSHVMEKMDELNAFMGQNSLQEIHMAFVNMIDTIFGFSDIRDGWHLDTLKESDDAYLFASVRKFLSPSGRFMDCVTNRLSIEGGTFKYDFPVALLSAIFEFLLSWRSSSYGRTNVTGGVPEPTHIQGLSVIPHSHAELSFKPSSCHMYLVRCFIKYLYHAAFQQPTADGGGNLQTPYHQLMHVKVVGYHRFLRNALCFPCTDSARSLHHDAIRQLNQLLVFCFQHWPYDLSFEIVIETWLTSIQPWRYAETAQPHGASPSPASLTQLTATDGDSNSAFQDGPTCPQSWSAFATQQYSLYVVPLLLLLQRASRMDLCVNRNAYMLYRVAKVFAQSDLRDMLRNVEEGVIQQVMTQNHYTDTTTTSSLLGDQTGLWGPEFHQTTMELLDAVNEAMNTIRKRYTALSPPTENAGLWNRFTTVLSSLFFDDESLEQAKLKKCEHHLQEASKMLRRFFLIEQPVQPSPTVSILKSPAPGRLQWDDSVESPLLPVTRSRTVVQENRTPPRRVQFAMDHPSPSVSSVEASDFNSTSLQSMSYSKSTQDDAPDMVISRFGQKVLTPFGRFQILTGQKRPDIRYKGDREYLPSCTYEAAILVELFRSMSGYINASMRPRFMRWCNTSGLTGRLARHVLLSSKPEECNPPGAESTVTDPRISLRWLASYAVLGRIFILYLVSSLLCGICSPILFAICLFLGFLAYQFVRLSILLLRDVLKENST